MHIWLIQWHLRRGQTALVVREIVNCWHGALLLSTHQNLMKKETTARTSKDSEGLEPSPQLLSLTTGLQNNAPLRKGSKCPNIDC